LAWPGGQVSVGFQLAWQGVTLRMEGPLMAVLSHDGTLPAREESRMLILEAAEQWKTR